MTAIVIKIISIYNKDDKICESEAKHVILKEKNLFNRQRNQKKSP